MNKDMYMLWPIELRRNIRNFGPRKGKGYWRFGLGSRWVIKRDGSRRILGWSFFIGRHRLIFGTC
jgi:hypothetical protein